MPACSRPCIRLFASSVATRASHVPALLARRPETMAHAVDDVAQLAPLLARAGVIALGPGLGQGEWGRQLLEAVLAYWQTLPADFPVVLPDQRP